MKRIKTKSGDSFQIITEAVYQENGQTMVVYQEMKEPFSIFVLEKEKFGRMIDGEVKPYVTEPAVFSENDFVYEETDEQKNASLMEEFLDAKTYHQKIQILESRDEPVPEEVLELLAMTMDITLEESSVEAKYDSLLQVLRTRERYEVDRR